MIRRASLAIAAALLSLPWWKLLPDLEEGDPERGVGIALVGSLVCFAAILAVEP